MEEDEDDGIGWCEGGEDELCKTIRDNFENEVDDVIDECDESEGPSAERTKLVKLGRITR
jgi:hypothetical protein